MVVFWEATTSRSLCNSDSITCTTGFCATVFTAVFVELSPGSGDTEVVAVIDSADLLDAECVVDKEEEEGGEHLPKQSSATDETSDEVSKDKVVVNVGEKNSRSEEEDVALSKSQVNNDGSNNSDVNNNDEATVPSDITSTSDTSDTTTVEVATTDNTPVDM